MTMLDRVGAEAQSTDGAAATLDIHQIVRHYAVLGIIIRRAIVVSDYLAKLPATVEQREGCIAQALDRVFTIFAANKMDAAAYHAALDAEIDGPDDDDFEDPDDDEFDVEPVENADVPGRPAAALAAELCRDLGMAMHAVPPDWLDPISVDLRLLCARAAAAAIKPTPTLPDKSIEGTPCIA